MDRDSTIDAPASSVPTTASATGDTVPASPAAIDRTIARHPRPLGGDTAKSLGKASLSLTGLVLDNQKSAQQMKVGRKPDWLRAKVPGGEGYLKLKALIDEHRLHTVCQEASCPNMGECWSRGTATIMILGDTCTRSCGFCNVKTGRPKPVDDDEPRRVAEVLAEIQLKHVVITSVDRDDQKDGGARIWAETIQAVHEACPETSVEVLVGDFKGVEKDIQLVCDALNQPSRSHGNEADGWFNASQTSWLVDARGSELVNEVIRLEDLEAAWPRLQRAICGLRGVAYADNGLRKNPSRHTHYSYYYDDAARRIVDEYMAIDLQRFGYAFETEPAAAHS